MKGLDFLGDSLELAPELFLDDAASAVPPPPPRSLAFLGGGLSLEERLERGRGEVEDLESDRVGRVVRERPEGDEAGDAKRVGCAEEDEDEVEVECDEPHPRDRVVEQCRLSPDSPDLELLDDLRCSRTSGCRNREPD